VNFYDFLNSLNNHFGIKKTYTTQPPHLGAQNPQTLTLLCTHAPWLQSSQQPPPPSLYPLSSLLSLPLTLSSHRSLSRDVQQRAWPRPRKQPSPSVYSPCAQAQRPSSTPREPRVPPRSRPSSVGATHARCREPRCRRDPVVRSFMRAVTSSC
jgi:hypothetical protein